MENHIENYKNYIIHSTEGTQKGIFLRNPFQTRDILIYHDDPYCEKYLKSINNPVRKLYEKIIGNGRIIKNIDNILNDIDCYGFTIKVICSPIYFKRNYRRLKAISTNNSDNIIKIKSYGYDRPFNICAGECCIERTTIKLRNRIRPIRIKQHETYNYTYPHIIRKVIDTSNI